MDDVLPLSSLEVAANDAPSMPTVNTLPGMPCSLADVAMSSGSVPDPMDDEVLSVSSSGTAGECMLSPDSRLKPGQSSPSDRSPLLASNSGVPMSLQLPPLQLPAGSRFFLDICSGATCPLASAAVALGIPAISVDVLRNPAHDLLDVAFFERILRLAFSGLIAMGHGSPPCCEYSLLKLRPGGAPPCRSPQHLNGLPGNDAAAENRVQHSHTILERTIAILYAVYQSGGHVSLEQPRNSMSWLEPAAQGQRVLLAWRLTNIGCLPLVGGRFSHCSPSAHTQQGSMTRLQEFRMRLVGFFRVKQPFSLRPLRRNTPS